MLSYGRHLYHCCSSSNAAPETALTEKAEKPAMEVATLWTRREQKYSHNKH
jgi:hypothetical protein